MRDHVRASVDGRTFGVEEIACECYDVSAMISRAFELDAAPRLILCVLALCAFFAMPVYAQDIRLEAEDFIGSHDGGYDPIVIVPCSEASGGLAVDGVDAVNDWISLDLWLDAPLCIRTAISSAGDLTLVRVFEISVTPEPGDVPLFSDTLRTMPGAGIG